MAEATKADIRDIVREETAGLRLDVTELKSDVSELKTDVSELKTDVSELKTDVSGLKADVSGLKQDVGVLKQDVSGLKHDVAGLTSETRSLRVMFEHFDAKIDTIAELVTTTVRTRRDVDDMGLRLGKLETMYEVQKRVVTEHSRYIRQLKGRSAS